MGKLDTFQPTYANHIYEEGAIYVPELPGETRLNDRELYIYISAFTLGMEADNPGAMARTICRRHLYKVGRSADHDALHYADSIEDDPILMGLMGYDTDNYD